jgi:hypothetical protein
MANLPLRPLPTPFHWRLSLCRKGLISGKRVIKLLT